MRGGDRYDSLIKWYAHIYGPQWRIVKRQIEAESSFDPLAVSPKGAMGLAQFKADTWDWVWTELLGVDPSQRDVWNPEHAIEGCCLYDRWLYDRFAEIPDEAERWRFALAAYNAGRGNINRALGHAREACDLPGSFKKWQDAGSRPGPWQTWDFASRFLPLVTGTNANETIGYIKRVMPDTNSIAV